MFDTVAFAERTMYFNEMRRSEMFGPIEMSTMIRYGQLTNDEYFVSEQAAKQGVAITNFSKSDPIVMLKHFGPDNPDLKA